MNFVELVVGLLIGLLFNTLYYFDLTPVIWGILGMITAYVFFRTEPL